MILGQLPFFNQLDGSSKSSQSFVFLSRTQDKDKRVEQEEERKWPVSILLYKKDPVALYFLVFTKLKNRCFIDVAFQHEIGGWGYLHLYELVVLISHV